MAMTSEPSYSAPGGLRPGTGPGPQAQPGLGLLRSLAILVASALLGLAGGLIWVQLAPRVSYVVVTHGSADVINPETSGFIAADATYIAIGVVAGAIIGLGGYLFAVRRFGPVPMAAVLVGSAGAALLARSVGEHHGLTDFNNQLLFGPIGTHLQAPLVLSGDNPDFWPGHTALPALAFWPLSACAVAGGIMLIVLLRERSAAAKHGHPPVTGPQSYGS